MRHTTRLLLAIGKIKGVGVKTLAQISESDISHITDAGELLSYVHSERFPLKRKNIKELKLDAVNNALNMVDATLESCEKNGIQVISVFDRDIYPERFRRLEDYPPYFFAKGNIECLKKEGIAVIGTRKPSDIGRRWGTRIAELFTENGFTVISGLAVGSDTCGHIGCLNKHGETIAVLPSPIENVYPAENKKLLCQILDNGGCAISEYPAGAFMSKSNFVARDRLQSGLAVGVTVIETGVTGGTWHAVNTGFKLGIPVAFLGYSDSHYLEFENARGNRLGIEEKGGYSIYDSETAKVFMSLCRQGVGNNLPKSQIKEQTTLF